MPTAGVTSGARAMEHDQGTFVEFHTSRILADVRPHGVKQTPPWWDRRVKRLGGPGAAGDTTDVLSQACGDVCPHGVKHAPPWWDRRDKRLGGPGAARDTTQVLSQARGATRVKNLQRQFCFQTFRRLLGGSVLAKKLETDCAIPELEAAKRAACMIPRAMPTFFGAPCAWTNFGCGPGHGARQ